MQNKSHLAKRIMAGVLAFALIGGILFVAIYFLGNPVSAYIVNREVKQYVAEKYSHLNLEIGKPDYRFQNKEYIVKVQSKTSMDTHFFISYWDGKVQGDTYKENIPTFFNTLERLSDEYSVLARQIIADELGYKKNTTTVRYDNYDKYVKDGRLNNLLELDMKFDREIPIDAMVRIKLDLKDQSLAGAARVLRDAHHTFIKNGCHFYYYSFYGETNNGNEIVVTGVTPEHIEKGNLLSLLEKAEKNGNTIEEGITVRIGKPHIP